MKCGSERLEGRTREDVLRCEVIFLAVWAGWRGEGIGVHEVDVSDMSVAYSQSGENDFLASRFSY